MSTSKGKSKGSAPRAESKAEEPLVAEVVATSSLNQQLLFQRRGSKYETIIPQVASLRHGQSLKIPIPKGEDPVTFRNNLSAGIKRKVKARGRLRFAVTIPDSEGRQFLAISCTPT